MVIFSLLTTAFSSVFYGIIATALIMAILYIVLKEYNKEIVKSVTFYVTGVVLTILLITQCSMMIGAIQAKVSVDSAEIYLSQILEGTASAQDSQEVMDAITEKFPIIGNFIDLADFSGHDISDLPEAMHDTMKNYLNSYIWHRIWWTLGIIVAACVIVIIFAPARKSTNHDNIDVDEDMFLSEM